MITEQQKEKIIQLTAKYDPLYVGVFGSFARNENHATSDLDLLVEFQKEVNLLELIGLEQELSASLKMKVDLVTKRSLNHLIAPYVQKDIIRIS